MEVAKQKKLKVPQLRFKEFNQEWEIHKIGEFISERKEIAEEDVPLYSLTIQDGIVAKSKRYERSFLVKGEVTDAYKVMYQGDFAFNPMNLRFGALAMHKDPKRVCVSKYYDIFYCSESVNPAYLEYYLTSYNMIQFYDKMSTGTLEEKKRVHYLDFIHFRKPFPTLPEQQKIAGFMSAIDEKLKHLNRKKELLQHYKKGVMQQLFAPSTGSGQAPELRFKREDGSDYEDWEEKKLGEVFERVTRKNKENNLNVLTISAQFGLINQEEYFNKSVSASNVTGYYLLHKGEFAYNKSYSNGYPMGAIKRLNRYEKGVVSTLYICFRIKTDDVPEYWEQILGNGGIDFELEKIAQEGARNHGLLNLSVVEFFRDIAISRPCKEEQQKIAAFLSSLDEKIDAVSAQIELTQQFKKGLLQEMFV